MYAVVGATGNTGRAVVKELEGLGEKPVCVVRNADKAKEVLGVERQDSRCRARRSRRHGEGARGRQSAYSSSPGITRARPRSRST